MVDKKVFIKLNGEIYVAPNGMLYIDKFKDFVRGNVIDADAMLSLKMRDRFKVKDRLFGYICNSVACMNGCGADNDYENICNRMSSVDQVIKYLASQGRIDEALVRMDSFMTDILAITNQRYSKQR